VQKVLDQILHDMQTSVSREHISPILANLIHNNTSQNVLIIASDSPEVSEKELQQIQLLRKQNDIIYLDIFDTFERTDDAGQVVSSQE